MVSSNVYTNKKGQTSVNIRLSVEDAAAFMVDNVDTVRAMKQAITGALSDKGHGDGES